jgi:hypothetical protein
MHAMRYSIKAGAIDKLPTECLLVPVWSKNTLSAEAEYV